MTDQTIEDGAHLWDRQPGEPERWYFRFMEYCRMGRSRSILGVFNAEREAKGVKRSQKISGAWRERTRQYDWQRRASAYDRDEDKRLTDELADKRIEHRTRALDLADRLIKKAEQMLQFPLTQTRTEQRTENGGVVVVNTIIPTRWAMRDAALILDTADKLARLALEMETQSINATIFEEPLEVVRSRRWASIQDKLSRMNGTDSSQAEDIPDSL